MAQETVDLSLSLVIDVSGSVDSAEYNLMMRGYSEAFRNPSFQLLAFSGDNGSIAVNVVQFSGFPREEIGWTIISSSAEANAFADQLENLTRTLPDNNGTDISEAIDRSASAFSASSFQAPVEAMVVAGDGPDNRSPGPAPSRDVALAQGIDNIYGIVIGDAVGGSVENHYRDEVIGGVSPILCRALNFNQFSEAILFKLSNIVGQFSDDCPVTATDVRFDQSIYTIDSGDDLSGSVLIDPVPAGGLYSHGTQILLRNSSGTLAGLVRPQLSSAFAARGVSLTAGPEEQSGTGVGLLKGSVELTESPGPAQFRSEIATFVVENLPPGRYSMALDFANDLGSSEDIFVTGCGGVLDELITFGTAQVAVVQPLPVIAATSNLSVEAQSGLIEHELELENSGSSATQPTRILVSGLPPDVELYNRHGTTPGGIPFVEVGGINGGASLTVVLEYFRVSRDPSFVPSYTLEVTSSAPVPSAGDIVDLDIRLLPLSGGRLGVEFLSDGDFFYTIEYSDDFSQWFTAQPILDGTGGRIQWIDSGPPKTGSLPEGTRFYRIRVLEPPEIPITPEPPKPVSLDP